MRHLTSSNFDTLVSGESRPGKGRNVAMLIVSPGNDIRAKKEADILQDAGYNVKFFGRNPSIKTPVSVRDDRHTVMQMPTISNAASLRALLKNNKSYYSFKEKLYGNFLASLMEFTQFKIGWSPSGLGSGIDSRDFLLHRRIESFFNRKADSLRSYSRRKRSVVTLMLAPFFLLAGAFGRRPLLILLFPLIALVFFWSALGLPFHALRKSMIPSLDKTWNKISSTTNPFQYPLDLMLAGIGSIAGLISLVFIPNPRAFLQFLERAFTWPFRKLCARVRASVAPRMRLYYQMASYFLYHLEVKPAVIDFKPDVIHAHDLYMLQAASRSAKELNAVVVYDAHELETDRHNVQKVLKDHIRRQEVKYGSKASGVITVGDEIAKVMNSVLGRDDVTLIYNSPFVGRTSHVSKDVRTDLGLDDKTPIALYVGKLFSIHVHDQRIENMIAAIAHVPGCHLAILGNVSRACAQEIKAWAKRYYIENRVHVLPPVPYNELVSYITTADVGINPLQIKVTSNNYSMPNKLFEYSLANVPVVQSYTKDSLEFLVKHGNGIGMDPMNPMDIARAVMDVLGSKPSYSLTKEKLESLTAEYSMEGQGEKLLKLYEAALN